MTFRAFCNALCILGCLDFDELHAAGIVSDLESFGRFCDNPSRAVLRLDGKQSDALWELVQAQMPAALQ